MQSRWSEQDAQRSIAEYGERWGERLALRTYAARLLGTEPTLVLHGGGNTSVKDDYATLLGRRPAVFVKASGRDLATIEPDGHPPLRLQELRALRAVASMSDEVMLNELRTHLFRHDSPTPSIESLVHAFLPAVYVDHTHANAILALTNRCEAREALAEALGGGVIVIEYVKPGFALAQAAASAVEGQPEADAMVWMHHGLVTWGDSARESYERTIDLVSRAEGWLQRKAAGRPVFVSTTSSCTAAERLAVAAPIVRGLLSNAPERDGALAARVVLQAATDQSVLDVVDAPGARELARMPPLTSDHLIRTKAFPAWVGEPDYTDPARLREQIAGAVDEHVREYRAYLERQSGSLPGALQRFDERPRVVVLPGLGLLAAGRDVAGAVIARDIAVHTLQVKAQVSATGTYLGLDEGHLAAMEYHVLQHAKLAVGRLPLEGRVALVTGAAGAIGAGVCEGLLEQGCHVAATDLPGDPLERLGASLGARFAGRAIAAPLDVTDAESVEAGFAAATRAWGGVDLVVINAGIALVSPLAALEVDAFRRLERVNVEGTLLLLKQAAQHFRLQGVGGDIVLVSTKNVFAPGAKFGAYSATKAASHQLGRIASLELAEHDVRVNMVSPDAVFGHGDRRSGLWKEVGPDRMRARGLDEAGLEEYYRTRNLLKAAVTARHVANAVLFFATRQTPTTGATIPVDGGLPDATPR